MPSDSNKSCVHWNAEGYQSGTLVEEVEAALNS